MIISSNTLPDTNVTSKITEVLKKKDPDARLQAFSDILKNAEDCCAKYYKDEIEKCGSKRGDKAKTAITKFHDYCSGGVAYEVQDMIKAGTATPEIAQGIVDFCCGSYRGFADAACEKNTCNFYIMGFTD